MDAQSKMVQSVVSTNNLDFAQKKETIEKN
jgi:hypothetical protein